MKQTNPETDCFSPKVRSTLFALFRNKPGGWFTAAEIAHAVGSDATPRKVAATMRQDRLGFHPEWCDSCTDTRIVGQSTLATHREVRVYRLSRAGLAAEFNSHLGD